MQFSTVLFLLIGVAFTVYAVLDGFDLGVGILSLVNRNPDWRKSAVESVTPFWDANGIWLILGGGGLLAAFPKVYAAVFSGFYLAVILLLVALLFRAMSLEFYERSVGARGKQFWMSAFGVSSFVIVLVLGVALGNILQGIPLDASANFTGEFLDLFTLQPLILALLAVLLSAFHGKQFLAYRSGGSQWGFLASSALIILLMATAGFSLYPNWVPSNPNPENSLTVINSAASPYACQVVTIILAVCLPCVFLFKLALYRTFRR